MGDLHNPRYQIREVSLVKFAKWQRMMKIFGTQHSMRMRITINLTYAGLGPNY
jgi:hypothetical protein